MVSDTASSLTLPIAWRAILALSLAVLTAHLLLATQYYATILVLGAAMAGLLFGVARLLQRVQSTAETGAANRAIAALQAEQKRSAQSRDHLQALLDTVTAA